MPNYEAKTLSELTKYDIFMNELLELEKSVHLLVQKEEEVLQEKKALINELKSLKDENEILQIKLEEAERRSEGFDTLNGFLFDSKDKKITKEKIDELIIKIDNHLRS